MPSTDPDDQDLSFSSDYVDLPRFSSSHEGPTDGLVSFGNDSTTARRRGTVPFYRHFCPLEPTISIDPQGDSKVSAPPNENTPLIPPTVPRVEEVGRHGCVDIDMVMFWEELRILIKYALPVFGYVHFTISYSKAILTAV